MDTQPTVRLCSYDSRNASTHVTFEGAAATWQANTALVMTGRLPTRDRIAGDQSTGGESRPRRDGRLVRNCPDYHITDWLQAVVLRVD